MQNHLATALQYHKAGFRVVPVNTEKRPMNLLARHGYGWQCYQDAQTEQDVKELFSKDSHGIAVLTGIDGLEVVDIDCKYSLTPALEVDYMKVVEELGGVLLTDFTIAKTPNKGFHVFFKCDHPGKSEPLAQRPLTPEEQAKEPKEKCKVLLETKGVGGLIHVYPTPGYTVDMGKMSTIPRITMAERAVLINAARSFNEYVKPEEVAAPPREAKKEVTFRVDGIASWDAYNEKNDCISLLEMAGWKVITRRGERVYMRRPGKNEGVSGNVNTTLNLFKCWSTSTEFDSDKSYSAYGVYTMLNYNGNWSASAKALFEQGYGEKGGVGRLPDTPIHYNKPTQTPDEIAAELAKRKFDFNKKPKNIDFILTAHVDGQSYDVGGFGMLGLVTGLEKSRKTTFLKALVASSLEDGRKRINFSLNLSGKKAIFVDTEQPENFFHSVQTHIHKLAGLRGNTPNYDAYAFRDLTIEQRNEYVQYLIDNTPDLGLLVLDGALDFVKNFNDEKECHALTQRLMQWTSKSGAMVLTVIHKTKGSGFMMGHLGSALARKCDFAFEMTHDNESGFTEVAHKYGRTKPFPKFDFTQDENGYPVLNHNEKINFEVVEERLAVVELEKPQERVAVLTTPNRLNDDEDIPF